MSNMDIINALENIQKMALQGQYVAKFLERNHIPYEFSISYVILVLYHYYVNDKQVYNAILEIVKNMYELLKDKGDKQ
jgi:hypothetical protein